MQFIRSLGARIRSRPVTLFLTGEKNEKIEWFASEPAAVLAGDTFKFGVKWEERTDIELMFLSITLTGVARVHYTDPEKDETATSSERVVQQQVLKQFPAPVIIDNTPVPEDGYHVQNGLSEGEHTFKVNFKIPNNAPPSIPLGAVNPKFEIVYFVKVSWNGWRPDSMDASRVRIIERDVVVWNPTCLCTPKALLQEASQEQQETGLRNRVSVEASLSSNIIQREGKINLQIQVKNGSKRHKSKILRVALIRVAEQHCIFQASCRRVVRELGQAQLPIETSVEPGKSYKSQFQLSVKSLCGKMSNQHEQLFPTIAFKDIVTLAYKLRISVGKHQVIELPVIVTAGPVIDVDLKQDKKKHKKKKHKKKKQKEKNRKSKDSETEVDSSEDSLDIPRQVRSRQDSGAGFILEEFAATESQETKIKQEEEEEKEEKPNLTAAKNILKRSVNAYHMKASARVDKTADELIDDDDDDEKEEKEEVVIPSVIVDNKSSVEIVASIAQLDALIHNLHRINEERLDDIEKRLTGIEKIVKPDNNKI